MPTLNLRAVRKSLGWTQQRAAERLGVSQALVSMVENGERSLTPEILDRLGAYYEVDPTNLPLREPVAMTAADFAREIGSLGYPGFKYLSEGKPYWNPAQFLILALREDDLECRLSEGLPWLVLRYGEMDWAWALREAKVLDLQNRFGFVVMLACELAEKYRVGSLLHLRQLESQIERSRLVRQSTFCNERMTQAERKWLQTNSSPGAEHWNLLSNLKVEHLKHVFPFPGFAFPQSQGNQGS